MHIFTYLQFTIKRGKAVTQTQCLLVQAYLCNAECQCSEAHSSVCLIHTSRLSLALMPRTSCSVSTANIPACVSVATRKKDFVTLVTVVPKSMETATSLSYSKHMPAHLPPRCGRDRVEVNKVAGFNRTYQSSVSIDCAGHNLLKTEDVWRQSPSVFSEQEAEADKKTG